MYPQVSGVIVTEGRVMETRPPESKSNVQEDPAANESTVNVGASKQSSVAVAPSSPNTPIFIILKSLQLAGSENDISNPIPAAKPAPLLHVAY